MARQRLIDAVLAQRRCDSREEARRLILSGAIRVNGHRLVQPAAFIRSDAALESATVEHPVSRAGQKLAFALERWAIHLEGVVAADIGAACGGFTECLLRHGAKRVYAIDTGKGQLAWKLRQDPRVVVMEDVNILRLAGLPEPVDMAVIDVSWTSLRQTLPRVASLIAGNGRVIALLKPNYEIQTPGALINGVLTDPETRREVVDQFCVWADENRWPVVDRVESPVTGDRGNVEWLVHLTRKETCFPD